MTNTFNRNDGTFAQVAYGDLNSTAGIFASSIATDIALNSTTTFFDGPTVSVGVGGTWLATGTVTWRGGSADNLVAKLWDGTTVMAATEGNFTTAVASLDVSGIITSPAGNIRISVCDASSTTGKLIASTGAKNIVNACTISCYRIG